MEASARGSEPGRGGTSGVAGGELVDHGATDLRRVLHEPAHRVSPRARVLWAAQVVLVGVLPVAGAALWCGLDEDHRGVSAWVLVALVLLWLALLVVVPLWRYAVHRWEVTETAVVTRTGWWTQERRLAPISRVQTVDVERGPIGRLLGLATVTVTTASSAGAVELEGLELGLAERLVAQLTEVTAATPGDAT